MKVRIILSGAGGELDRQTIKVNDVNMRMKMGNEIHEALRCWWLAPGDTIKIVEVE